MPTPFYHLNIAENLLQSAALSEPVRQRLSEQRCAFLLGNTAPDVQVISGQPRQATHFFALPVDEHASPPWTQLLAAYPALAHPLRLAPAHAAFLAGYLCHLLADWLWIREIYAPVFGPDCAWDTFSHRLYLHNVLRAHLDRQVFAALSTSLGDCLDQVTPQGWLFFVEDRHLSLWRDFLSSQLHPGAYSRTVEVFARRAGVSPADFTTLLDSTERMQAEVFARLPAPRLSDYRQRLLNESVRLLYTYLECPKPDGQQANLPVRRRAAPTHRPTA